MGLPRPPEARIYYRAGKKRFDDAQLLLREERTTGAVYLAGYTVESLPGLMGGCKMSIKIRGNRSDAILHEITDALHEYDKNPPKAKIELYRQNSVSVRIRILNPEFDGRSRGQREEEVWAILNKLPEETLAEISLLLLLTPNEAKSSFANIDFEEPIPSKL
jgi:hypothetical protein